MEIVTIIFLIFVYFITRQKNIINPISMYVWIWFPILLLSSMGIMGMKIPSQFAYFIIFLGTLFFAIGYCFPAIKCGERKVFKYEINYKLLITFEIAAIIVLLPQATTSFLLLMKGYKLGHIHSIVTSGDFEMFYSNRTRDIFYYLFVYPTILSGVIFSAYDVWFGKKNKLLQLCTVTMVALRILQYGGRAPVFNLVFAYAVGGLLRIFSEKKHNSNVDNFDNRTLFQRITKMIPLLILGGTGLIYSVVSRLANGFEGVSAMFVEYFAACPVILSEKLALLGDNFVYTCGLFTVFGFYQFLNKIVEVVFGLIGAQINLPFFDILYDKAVFIEKGVDIGSGISNAFVTPFYYFYNDGWLFGVVLLSFIWGNLCKKAYREYIVAPNLKSVYFLLFVLFSICFSMEGSWLRSPQMALAIPFFYIFAKKEPPIS